MKVLICEDHPIYRQGVVKDIMDYLQGPHIIHEAGDGHEALKYIQNNTYDIILMDIKLPGKSGMDLLKLIQIQCPEQRVLMLTFYEEAEYALAAHLNGAAGYLTKTVSPRKLTEVMQIIVKGGRYFSVETEEMAVHANKCHNKAHREFGHPVLTDCQYRLLVMFCEDRSYLSIAEELNIGEKTVSSHKNQIKKLMNFADDWQMRQYYRNHIQLASLH